jgi:hypothetical protein
MHCVSLRVLNSSLSQDKFRLELRGAPEGHVDELDLGGKGFKFSSFAWKTILN